MLVGLIFCQAELIFFILIRRHAQPLLQIGASTERIVAFAREDQSPRATFTLLFVQTLDDTVQLAEQLLRNRIAGFGTVEREDCDGA